MTTTERERREIQLLLHGIGGGASGPAFGGGGGGGSDGAGGGGGARAEIKSRAEREIKAFLEHKTQASADTYNEMLAQEMSLLEFFGRLQSVGFSRAQPLRCLGSKRGWIGTQSHQCCWFMCARYCRSAWASICLYYICIPSGGAEKRRGVRAQSLHILLEQMQQKHVGTRIFFLLVVRKGTTGGL